MPYYIGQHPDCNGEWSVVKDDGTLLACHTSKDNAIAQMVAVSLSENLDPAGEYQGEYRAPAPKKDQVFGSDKNPKGSAKGAGGDIKLDDKTETALRNKVSEHNKEMEENNKPDWSRTTFGQLAAVYRRGAGAYSISHRPGVSRGAWAMGRVNAYLYLLRNGNPENKNYVTDNDLLPSGHPKSTRSVDFESREIDLTPPAYMRAAARQGLRYYAEGKAGDGLVDRTVREARAMASGSVTADKWVRIRAWIARHLVDLKSPDANPNSDNYPSAGVVAHLLWGSGPTLRGAQRALEYADGIVTRLEDENRNKYVEGEAMAKFEVRTTPANFEIREDETGMYFEGYAAVFDSPSEPLPFIERIARGAFRMSLKKSRNDIKLLWNHDTSLVLGSSRAKTLTLTEDERGLKVSAQLPNTSAGRDAKELLARGDVDSMSFGFSVPSGGDVWNAEGTERTLKSVRLHEVSIVAFPAYSGTAGTTSVRGIELVAERSLVDADQLQDAIVMMEAGGTLTTEAANILRRVIDTLEVEDEPLEDMEDELPEEMPEESTDASAPVEETNDGDFSALELVKAKLWLLERK